MRIALLPDGESTNTAYRSIGPITALAEQGHEVRRIGPQVDPARGTLQWCDVLHVHRHCNTATVTLARTAKAAGAAVVWDDDDDLVRPPKEIAAGGLADGARRLARRNVRSKLFQTVDLVTTPSHVLADVFQRDGAPETRVIENHVIDSFLGDRLPRGELCIGWVACLEHRLDLRHVPITRVLTDLLDAHPHLHVVTIGIRLDIEHDRYRHVHGVPLHEMLRQVSAFDIGIAPLSADVPINLGRSNVKVKEYAAVGVPWLASPVGPYVGLGERQGGRLVDDDRWYDALDALVRSARARRKLAKRATRWGREQLLSRNVGQWEHSLAHAVAHARTAARAA
jgi:hypothetical protein